ncbi:hypothetical protein B0T18DRAFT_412726 [Schizothecium vesticola]|uniref:Uncharacterized protein n=1 Tax=Schizothecium vesticola TaxID=314040 RepID=A0AA40EWK4_9PEZI|nr:hypothetical protein B0T18DRAFT_412726 [Schizothecium vesticola]
MAAPPVNLPAPFRRPPPLPATSPRGRPTPKRSRSDAGPRDHADDDSFPSNKRRQCSREEYVPGGHGGDDRDAGPRHNQPIDSYRPDDDEEYDPRQYFKGHDNYHSDDGYDEDGNDDAKGLIPVRLGNHRVLPPTGLQIRGGAYVRENGPHPGIKQEPEHYDEPRSPPKPLPLGRPLLDRHSNDIFWNLPSQYHSPFTSLIKALDRFTLDLEYASGPKYADNATYAAYKELRHLAGLTHTLNNKRGPSSTVAEDLRTQVADANERNEILSAEIRALKKDASVVNMKRDREAMARQTSIRNEQTKKTSELAANVERLEREVQAKKEDRARLAAKLEQLEKHALAGKDDKAKLAGAVMRLESEVQAEKDDKARLAESVTRLESEVQAEKDDKAKLVQRIEHWEKEAQVLKGDKARLEAVAEQTAKERHSLATRLDKEIEKAERAQPDVRQNSDTNNPPSRFEVSSLKNTLNQLRERKNMLAGEVAGLRNQTSALTEENGRLREQVRGLTKEGDRLKDGVRVMTREGDSLKDQVCDLMKEKVKLNDHIRNLASEKQGFKCQTLALNESKDELLGKIKNLMGEKDNLAKENSRLNDLVVDLKQSKEVFLAKINTLGKDNKVLAGEKGALGKSNKALDDQVMLLNTRVYSLVEENTGLAGEKETLSKENKNLNDKVLTLTKTKEKYIATVNNLTDERNNLAKLLAQKDLEIQALRTQALSAAQQQAGAMRDMQGPGRLAGAPNGRFGEAGGSAQEPSPYIKQEPRQFQLSTPTTSSGPGFPMSSSRAISIDTLPSPSPGPGGQVQTMSLPAPESSDLAHLSHLLNEGLSFLIRKILEWDLSQNKVVIDFVANIILSRIAADTCRPAVTRAKGHWEVQEPWLTGEAMELQARVRQVANTNSVDEQFMRLCSLVEHLRNPAETPNLLVAAIPTLVASLMKADFSSSSATAMAFLETTRSLPPPSPAVGQAFNTQRAALALMICELCRVLERTLPDAKRSIWKIGSILGPDAQAAAEKLPIGKLADNLSYGPSAHLTKTHLAAECGDRFCILPVPGVEGRPQREIGLLYPGGESREGEAEEGQYFLMIDFAGPALRLVDSSLADTKDTRATKAESLRYDLAISRDEGGREVELFHVAAAPKKVFMFWVNYVQGFK